MNSNNIINVIGLGYIGLPTALMLAKHSINVIGTDYNVELVESLKKGILTFKEPGIEQLYEESIKKGKIKFNSKYIKTNMYIVAVQTPYDSETHKIDSKYIVNAVEQIMKICELETTIIIESTISPGTVDKYIRPVIKKNIKENQIIHIAHAPERIIPGNMIFELVNNSRTIGADNMEIANTIKEIYSSFCTGEIILTDVRTAEMSKVVENTFRDVNIAFANELMKICSKNNMDVYEIIRIANKHPRVNILSPGPGVGGHCISVDPWFLVGDFPEDTKIIKTAREINDSMPEYVLDRIIKIMKKNRILKFNRVGIYGLAYKEDVDDCRESPALQLYSILKEKSIEGIKFYDPFIKKKYVDNQMFNFDDFISELDLIVVFVAHKHILENTKKIENLLVLDTKNKLDNISKILL